MAGALERIGDPVLPENRDRRAGPALRKDPEWEFDLATVLNRGDPEASDASISTSDAEIGQADEVAQQAPDVRTVLSHQYWKSRPLTGILHIRTASG